MKRRITKIRNFRVKYFGTHSHPSILKKVEIFSNADYNNWVNKYDQIINIGNIYPLYLFHDVDKLPQLIVDSLKTYLGVSSQLIKLQQ